MISCSGREDSSMVYHGVLIILILDRVTPSTSLGELMVTNTKVKSLAISVSGTVVLAFGHISTPMWHVTFPVFFHCVSSWVSTMEEAQAQLLELQLCLQNDLESLLFQH